VYDNTAATADGNLAADAVYILTLPAFHWVKVNYTPTDPRVYHTCHIIGNRQLLSVGGLNPALLNSSLAWNETDRFAEGLKIFDMTTLNWTNYYDANAAPYEQSNLLKQYYASNPRYPAEWNDEALGWILNPASKPPPPTATATSSPSPHHRQTGTIIGGVIGGVGGLFVVSAILGFILYKQRKAKTAAKQEAERRRRLNEKPPAHFKGELESPPPKGSGSSPRMGELESPPPNCNGSSPRMGELESPPPNCSGSSPQMGEMESTGSCFPGHAELETRAAEVHELGV
jgi:hypothetical protein